MWDREIDRKSFCRSEYVYLPRVIILVVHGTIVCGVFWDKTADCTLRFIFLEKSVNYLRVFDEAVKLERPSNANNKLVSLSRHKPHKPITTELACVGLLNKIAGRPRYVHIVQMVVIWVKTLSSACEVWLHQRIRIVAVWVQIWTRYLHNMKREC
jgi:hypothetical protein